MSERKHFIAQTAIVLTVSLLAAILSFLLLANYEKRIYFRILGDICGQVIEDQPEAEQAVLSALKKYADKNAGQGKDTIVKQGVDQKKAAQATGENILQEYGYKPADFMRAGGMYGVISVVFAFVISAAVILSLQLFWRKREMTRIEGLREYLEKVNTGGGAVLVPGGEDDFAKLQDEIYKTVTELYQTRELATKAKNNFADHLYNIAHQMKTPLTSLFLSVQMMEDAPSKEHLKQVRSQIARLTYLEEALLLLSRIDAGTLPLERKEVDVFTVLMLSADNLQELLDKADVSIHIPEAGEMMVQADLDWTMEALMNLFKNCMEHTPPGGTVYCSYEQNPLYTEIRIWDNGAGFAKEDMPHLFERFYRGKNAKDGGIGIGLALAKAIIERQNGTVCARNLAEGGACFEIHFYCH